MKKEKKLQQQQQDKDVHCWNCKEKGHTRAQCQKQSKRHGDMYCKHCKMTGHEVENCRKLGNSNYCTHCKIGGHDMKACRKLAAQSVNMLDDKILDQSINMATTTTSRKWCAAMSSKSESMPTMEVLVSPAGVEVNIPHTVTALVDTGASLCIMTYTAWRWVAHTGKLKKCDAVIVLADQSYELKTLGEAECVI